MKVARMAVLLAGLALAGCAGSRAEMEPGSKFSPGERAFQRCYACHALSADEAGLDGPPLAGVVDRRIAGMPGYRYSEAMSAVGATGERWTRTQLDAFLTDPQSAIPGNAMGFFGIADPAERAVLIDWLAGQSDADH